jgi:hypothetical protein
MTQDVDIPTGKASQFVKRWRKLTEQRAKIDFETAGLAAEMRDEFPKGPSGDYQFRIWCCHHLEIYGATAAMLARAARAFRRFPEEKRWLAVGGWQSIGFVMRLNKAGRTKVMNHAVKLAAERGRPVGYTTVRNIAYHLGVTQDQQFGRPNRLQVEENLGFLRTWVEKLYGDYDNLPALPPEVRAALKPTKLAQIADAAKA